jgi:hypothetical protein
MVWQDEPSKRSQYSRVRAFLVIMGLLIAATGIVFAAVPIRRVESIARTMAAPTASPSASAAPNEGGALALQQEIRTEKALPDAVVVLLLTAGSAMIVAGVLFTRVDEFTIGGVKVRLARAVADATLEKARRDGVVAGDTVPTDAVAQMLQETAVAAVDVERRLLHQSGRPFTVRHLRREASDARADAAISRRLLDELAAEAVADASSSAPQSPPAE